MWEHRGVIPKSPEPGLDPYRAPSDKESAAPAAEEQEGAFATRVSIGLAVLGVALFWGVLLLVRNMPWQYKPTGLAMSRALFLSVTMHLVGFGVVFAAPPGKRALGLTLNSVALLLMVGLLVWLH
jgi:hypothetical protein